MTGVQAATINGDVSITDGVPAIADLIVRRASRSEMAEVADQFVTPGGFPHALDILTRHGAVILYGRNSGRTFAAHRMLANRGATAVVHMNPNRTLGSVREDEVEQGRGYIWDASNSGGHPFTDWEFTHCAHVMRSTGCCLVIIVDHRSQVSPDAVASAAELTAPNAVEVALATLPRLRQGPIEPPMLILKSDLAAALDDRDPPEKAVWAAKLAIRVAETDLSVDDALRELREDLNTLVARWFEQWSIREFAVALAVALLENEPFDEVMRHAIRFDEHVRKAELPEDRKLRPRRVFEKPKDALLRDIQAVVTQRDHPVHEGLKEETVRFARQGWAMATLRYVWSEYPSVHGVACSRSG